MSGKRPMMSHPGIRHQASEAASASLRHVGQRYLPTLFDRLCDDSPSERSEAPDAYVPDRRRMRETLLRDLSLLLNTINHDASIDAGRFPEAARSCLNYGVPALAGSTLSERKWRDIEQGIRRAVLAFEPRILANSLRIRPLLRDEAAAQSLNVLVFEISGQIHMQPYPIEFIVQSSADLEANRIELRLPDNLAASST